MLTIASPSPPCPVVQVEEGTPLFLSLPDLDGDSVADELCLAARHQLPFSAAPGTPLTLTYFLCSADDVRKVSYPFLLGKMGRGDGFVQPARRRLKAGTVTGRLSSPVGT